MLPFSARMFLALGFVTLASRFLLAHYLGVEGRPEMWEYDVIAESLARGDGHLYDRAGFVYAAYAPPLWSFVLALLLEIPGGSRASIQILQAFLCLGSALVYADLARRISGRADAATLAGFLVALQPSLLYYSVANSDPLPMNVLLLGLIATAGVRLVPDPHPGRAASFGLLLALGVLARGTPIVALPLVVLWLVARWRRRALIPVALTLAGLAAGLAPWVIRNERLLGRAFITSTVGENFWRGNHPGASGGVIDDDGGRITSLAPTNEALPAVIRSVLRNGTEAEREDVFMTEALRFIRDQPSAAAYLFARKMRTFWWRIESDPRDYSQAASLGYEVVYRAELAFALLGVLTVFGASRGAAPAAEVRIAIFSLALMAGISILQSLFYVQGRHRFLIEPLLLMFTAEGATAVLNGLRHVRAPSRPGP